MEDIKRELRELMKIQLEMQKHNIKMQEQQNINARDIDALTKNVEAIVNLMRENAKSADEQIHELIIARTECHQKMEHIFERMDSKKEFLDNLDKKLSHKVDKSEFKSVTNRLWAIGGSVVTILIGALGFMISQYIKRS